MKHKCAPLVDRPLLTRALKAGLYRIAKTSTGIENRTGYNTISHVSQEAR